MMEIFLWLQNTKIVIIKSRLFLKQKKGFKEMII